MADFRTKEVQVGGLASGPQAVPVKKTIPINFSGVGDIATAYVNKSKIDDAIKLQDVTKFSEQLQQASTDPNADITKPEYSALDVSKMSPATQQWMRRYQGLIDTMHQKGTTMSGIQAEQIKAEAYLRQIADTGDTGLLNKAIAVMQTHLGFDPTGALLKAESAFATKQEELNLASGVKERTEEQKQVDKLGLGINLFNDQEWQQYQGSSTQAQVRAMTNHMGLVGRKAKEISLENNTHDYNMKLAKDIVSGQLGTVVSAHMAVLQHRTQGFLDQLKVLPPDQRAKYIADNRGNLLGELQQARKMVQDIKSGLVQGNIGGLHTYFSNTSEWQTFQHAYATMDKTQLNAALTNSPLFKQYMDQMNALDSMLNDKNMAENINSGMRLIDNANMAHLVRTSPTIGLLTAMDNHLPNLIRSGGLAPMAYLGHQAGIDLKTFVDDNMNKLNQFPSSLGQAMQSALDKNAGTGQSLFDQNYHDAVAKGGDPTTATHSAFQATNLVTQRALVTALKDPKNITPETIKTLSNNIPFLMEKRDIHGNYVMNPSVRREYINSMVNIPQLAQQIVGHMTPDVKRQFVDTVHGYAVGYGESLDNSLATRGTDAPSLKFSFDSKTFKASLNAKEGMGHLADVANFFGGVGGGVAHIEQSIGGLIQRGTLYAMLAHGLSHEDALRLTLESFKKTYGNKIDLQVSN